MKINEIYTPSNFIDILLFHITKHPNMLQYMKDCVSYGAILHHNSNSVAGDFKLVTDTHKAPQEGSHNYFGEYFDDYFEKKFGIRFRKESIYTTLSGASSYGSPFILLPTSSYQLCYSNDVFDLYLTWQKVITDIIEYNIDTLGVDINLLMGIVFDVLRNNESSVSDISGQLELRMKKSGIDPNTANTITNNFINEVILEADKILSKYTTTNSISNLDSSVKESNNEIMIISKSYLLLNRKSIISKTSKSPLELFANVIERFEKGERF